MTTSNMQVEDIYQVLSTGAKLATVVDSMNEANNLRAAIYRFKKQHEAAMMALGEPEKLTKLSFTAVETPDGLVEIKFHLYAPPVSKAYNIVVVTMAAEGELV